MDETLSWSSHINNIVSKMSRNISNIRRSTCLLDKSIVIIVKLIINSLVLSHLNYCPTVWSSASKKDLSKPQLIQNRAAHLALRCSITDSVMGTHARLLDAGGGETGL